MLGASHDDEWTLQILTEVEKQFTNAPGDAPLSLMQSVFDCLRWTRALIYILDPMNRDFKGECDEILAKAKEDAESLDAKVWRDLKA